MVGLGKGRRLAKRVCFPDRNEHRRAQIHYSYASEMREDELELEQPHTVWPKVIQSREFEEMMFSNQERIVVRGPRRVGY